MPKDKKNTDEINQAEEPERKKAKKGEEEDEEGNDDAQKKPRGRPKGSRNSQPLEGVELGLAAAQALGVPPMQMPPIGGMQPMTEEELKPIERGPMSKAREVRLEQNRKAARESRRRKKVMIEELQRSVIFFSRANGTLKQQNEEFQRLLISAQAQIAQLEAKNAEGEGGDGTAAAPAPTSDNGAGADAPAPAPVDPQAAQQAVAAAQAAQQFQFQNLAQAQQAAHAQAAAMQASYESQGFPPAAARAAAQTFTATTDGTSSETTQPQMPPFDANAMQAFMQHQMAMNPALFQQQWQMMAAQQGAAAPAAPAPAAGPAPASAGDSTTV